MIITQVRRRAVPRTMPARIRALAAGAALAVTALFVAVSVGLGDARDGLQVIGHDAGPQVVATSDLYFALSDMDAQLANVLLTGREHRLGPGRDSALKLYDQRRGEADRAVLQTFDIAGQDPVGQRTIQSVLDRLGSYERLASQALLLDDQSAHAAGPPPQKVRDLYRQATDLMRRDLLPQAYNLTLESSTIVRRSSEAQRSDILTARVWVALSGLAVIALLVALQFFLARRFRRLLNPALVLATVVSVGLVAASSALLSSTAGHLRDAKEQGFDLTLALARGRAISNSAAADQTRFLLDPARADTYEQNYLDKSQSIAYVPAGNLRTYYQALDRAVVGRKVPLGFLAGQTGPVLEAYRAVQRDDRRLRSLSADGRTRDAIMLRTGSMVGNFQVYDAELGKLIKSRWVVFGQQIGAGDRGLHGWRQALPPVALAIVLLILLGIRPRLSEYR
ncbi:MAG: hypothetical protein ABIS86_15755 [Streptosporangiaceae bacterium]